MKVAHDLNVRKTNNTHVYYLGTDLDNKIRIAKTPDEKNKMYEAVSYYINCIQTKKRLKKYSISRQLRQIHY